ncbi:MAG: alanine racemase [Rhodothermales bacterium]|nr:alanine racemase [Rhodothermales bacterium]
MRAPTRAEISLAAIRRNLDLIRTASGRPVMAVVKANAYGHGAIPVSSSLVEAGVERFAVATLPEAVALRDAGLKGRVLVFGVPHPDELEAFVDHGLELTVSTPELLTAVLEGGLPLAVQLQIDTGMVRLGLPTAGTAEAIQALSSHPSVSLTGVFTHFASADLEGNPQTAAQLEAWRQIRALVPAGVETHAAASGGVFTSLGVAAESDVIRAGISLYGLYDPAADVPAPGLQPAMRLLSRVVRIQEVTAGTQVSYGGRWTAPGSGRILTIVSGYADGVPRALSSRGHVGLGPHRLPIAGTVCMDMFMAFTEDPAVEARVGDEVVIWGPGGPSVLEVARIAGTIPYEIVCGVSQRVERVFTN